MNTCLETKQNLSAAPKKPVLCYNEWDPLEEVIVGVMNGACIPEWHVSLEATMPEESESMFRVEGGKPFPQEHVELAIQELDEFARILQHRGICVTRPDRINHRHPFSTPHWKSPSGLYSAMPRDFLIVVGETIIEAPMAWRSRYFEFEAYRPILKDYFRRGAKWISAPKPQLLDDLYDEEYDPIDPQSSGKYVVNEFEPTFDAADFIRCGRDIFAQKSHVTNQIGIDWFARHIGEEYTVHQIEVTDSAPMHIDASFMPLAPGKLLLNQTRVKKIPEIFKNWEIKFAPEPALPKSHRMYMSSAWINMNVIMLDETHVVVERQETPLIDLLEKWGFTVVPVDFRNVMRFGGAFHCVTCDVRRRGSLQSYF
jgi:glycine amidinotransferase